MRAVIALDSFKGSLSSIEAGNAVSAGIRRVYSDAEMVVLPLADGGEGTVDALVSGMDGTIKTVSASDPLGRKIKCKYGIIDNTAVIEMSAAAGITLLSESERDPMNTTTYGVGEIISDAVMNGCREFIVGIGGSATNDGGIGMLQALGFEMLDKYGRQVPFGARGIDKLTDISDKNVISELKNCRFYIACDVKNPLCGPEGCSAVYGPQKGATSDMIERMDKSLERYAALTHKKYPHSNSELPGTGAAGGMGFAFMAYMNAKLQSGAELIIKKTRLEDYIKKADIVITGEGRIDSQTAMGKAPAVVAALAERYNVPVIAFAGSVTKDAVKCNRSGIDAYFPVVRGVCTLDEALDRENARSNISDTAEQVFRLLKYVNRLK